MVYIDPHGFYPTTHGVCKYSGVRTVLLEFQGKLGLYKYSFGHGKFAYFPNLALLDRQAQNKVSKNDLLIYINHHENLVEDRKSSFCVLQGMVVPDYIISPFE